MREMARGKIANGLSPDTVADQVLNAIREDRFYILTHPELKPVIQKRMDDILEDRNPTSLRPR